jgi:PAS domain-containing protein
MIVRRCRRRQTDVNEEWITYADDGHRALLRTTKTPMIAADGRPIGVLGIAHDITEMRHQEEALRDSRETLNRAQAVAHVGSWMLDIDADRLEWSDECVPHLRRRRRHADDPRALFRLHSSRRS